MDTNDTMIARRAFIRKVTAKAIQSEVLAAEHYRALATIVPDVTYAERLVRDAATETRHALALLRAGEREGLDVPKLEGWDEDMSRVRQAFASCVEERDFAACMFIQDVFLENVTIAVYETLAQAAQEAGARSLAVLVEKSIVPDERIHLWSGLREITRYIPAPVGRLDAFRRAATAILPSFLAIVDPPASEPCSVLCRTCGDACLKSDAAAASISFGTFRRVASQIDQATRKIGIDQAFMCS
jgi:hypothetical protein